MGADLHIHVYDPKITKQMWEVFNGPIRIGGLFDNSKVWDMVMEEIHHTPSVWIGEVSWLKAAILGDQENFVPTPVKLVYDLLPTYRWPEGLAVLTEELRLKILDALQQPNTIEYYSVASVEDVDSFLREHYGEKLFTVSW